MAHGNQPPPTVNWTRRQHLAGDKRQLIGEFIRHASAAGTPFSALLNAWIAFNGFGFAATFSTSDNQMIHAFAADAHANQIFEELLTTRSDFRAAVAAFSKEWPVYSESAAYLEYKKQNPKWDGKGWPDDNALAALCRKGDGKGVKYQPLQPKTINWSSVLWAIYQVRCNLFHGGKNPLNPRDRTLTKLSAKILLEWMHAAGVN